MNFNKKIILTINLMIAALLIFILAGSNSVFAGNNEDCGCPGDIISEQTIEVELSLAEKSPLVTAERNDIFLQDISKNILSLFTPKDAWADTSVTFCINTTNCTAWNAGGGEFGGQTGESQCTTWASAECGAHWGTQWFPNSTWGLP